MAESTYQMETPRLRLVGSPAETQVASEQSEAGNGSTAHSLRMERRSSHRWPLRGHAMVTELTPDRFGRSHEADLLDHCSTGLGLMCTEPLEPGTWVDLRFDGLGFPMQRGIVVRCQRCADGWRVSVQTEQRRAA